MIERLYEVMREVARPLGKATQFDPRQALRRNAPLPLQPPGRWSANRHCKLIQAQDGWLAVNLAREDDRLAIAAWLGCEQDDLEATARQRPCTEMREQAVLLGMPVAVVNESLRPGPGLERVAYPDPGQRLTGVRILDLSALWAGPYCGALLAEAGAEVTKLEFSNRPDPTGSDPRLNGDKIRVIADFCQAELLAHISRSHIFITSARPHALARLGLNEATLFSRNPSLIWIAITAYGWSGEASMRVGFGDDCAAAGGLLDWTTGTPHFIGDALADPLTGLRAASAARLALAERRSGLIDMALAPTAALFAQAAGIG